MIEADLEKDFYVTQHNQLLAAQLSLILTDMLLVVDMVMAGKINPETKIE